MKSPKFTLEVFLFIILSFSAFKLKAHPGNPYSGTKNKAAVALKQVFTSELDASNKDVLKLYDDNSYEFLFFQVLNKKARVKRERGTYEWKHNKLVLNRKGKNTVKEHPSHFVFVEEKGLFRSKLAHALKKTSPEYQINNDSIFWETGYFDSIFGEITNDKNAAKKIIEIKKVNATPPSVPKRPIEDSEIKLVENLDYSSSMLSRDSLKQLKAVIVVGPLEKDTPEYIEEQKKTAEYLRSFGVHVVEFYHPNAKWKDISEASKGANIFIYVGHGSVSILALTNEVIDESQILMDLKLHKNAIVIFNHACEAAGSSATDKKDIGKAEALRRVGGYARPYIEKNAGAYYANNYDYCLIPFFTSFFRREPIKQIYTEEANKWTTIEAVKKYPFDSKFEISVASLEASDEIRTITTFKNGIKKLEKVKDFKTYLVAYVGKPAFTVSDLFQN